MMKVRVLNILDADNGYVMDTYVFKEEAVIKEIIETIERVFQEEEGTRSYCEIIPELYGHLLLDVVENREYDW